MDPWSGFDNSADSGLGLDGHEFPKCTIYDDDWWRSCLAFPHDSPGRYESNEDSNTSAYIPISETYLCDLCD
jgi:hypothetical protein